MVTPSFSQRIKDCFVFLSLLLTIGFILIAPIYADTQDEVDTGETFIRAKILSILHAGIQTQLGVTSWNEKMTAQVLEGKHKNTIISVDFAGDALFGDKQKINTGETVVIDSKPDPTGRTFYTLYEPYRLNNLWWLLAGFILLIIIVAGKKGIGSLIGLAISIATISLYIIPHIIKGEDPLTICLIGVLIILFLTTYIAHGFSLKTTVALGGTALSLVLTIVLSYLAVSITHLLGLGNEDVYNLQIGTSSHINPQGLLLGSILIGTLGALNDITTTQAITIFTLAKENPTQHVSHLFYKSMTIGREHIASLINTLVLAYAGSSLAIFIFFALNPAHLPWWLILNNETTMEEIIRTMVGSSALILAVPITTIIASYVALRWKTMLSNFKNFYRKNSI